MCSFRFVSVQHKIGERKCLNCLPPLTAITFLILLGFVGISDAIEILEMRPEDGNLSPIRISGDCLYHRTYVKTSQPYASVDWYVDGVYVGASVGDLCHLKIEAYFSPYWLTGSVEGTSYTIKANARPLPNDPDGFVSDTESYELTVYSPFEIVEMKSTDGSYEDYNYENQQGDRDLRGIWHLAYLETSEPYHTVKWYINDVLEETSFGNINNPRYEAYFSPYWLPGSLRGTTYEIKAVASFTEDGPTATDSYGLTVYAPKFTRTAEVIPQNNPDVSGYVELTRQYYDGENITIDCKVVAYNFISLGCKAYSRFKHALTGRMTIERDHPIDAEGILVPQPIGHYLHSDSLSHPNIGEIGEDERLVSQAYVRLVVNSFNGEDNWFVDNTEIFTDEDNIEPETPETPPLQPTQWGAIKEGP